MHDEAEVAKPSGPHIIVVILMNLCYNGMLSKFLVRGCFDSLGSTNLIGMRTWASFLSCFCRVIFVTFLGLAGLWQTNNYSDDVATL